MKRSLFGLSLFAVLSLELVSISAVAQATNNNLVQNGSFETGYEATTQINGGWPNNRRLLGRSGTSGRRTRFPIGRPAAAAWTGPIQTGAFPTRWSLRTAIVSST